MIKELLRFVTKKLEELNIEYMISGSVAMNLYTIPRMTRDIDLVVHLSKTKIQDFVSAFSDRFYCHQASIEEAIQHQSLFNLIDTQSGYKIDFLIRKYNPYRIKEFERRQRKEIFGFQTWVVSIEDLIISKLVWIQDLQSEKQIEDTTHLLENDEIDHQYIKNWIKELSLNTFGLYE